MPENRYFYLIMLLILLVFFAAGYKKTAIRRNMLKLRILVNGTRGKSSVTRLISAGLDGGVAYECAYADSSVKIAECSINSLFEDLDDKCPILNSDYAGLKEVCDIKPGNIYTVLGKTTGTSPRWLFPGGSEATVYRTGNVNIREMALGLKLAQKLTANTYVAECMAVEPRYQKAVEKYYMRAHICVITNIRPDHEDVYGEGCYAVAKAISSSFPINGVVVAPKETALLFKDICPDFQGKIIPVETFEVHEKIAKYFNYNVIADNLSLALAVCSLVGITPSDAVKRMIKANDDPGNLEILNIKHGAKKIKFISAFAVNDTVSAEIISKLYPAVDDAYIIYWLHTRDDRRQRTISMCSFLRNRMADMIVISGDNKFAAGELIKIIPDVNLHFIHNGEESDSMLEDIINTVNSDNIWIMGLGNTKGIPAETLYGVDICRKL